MQISLMSILSQLDINYIQLKQARAIELIKRADEGKGAGAKKRIFPCGFVKRVLPNWTVWTSRCEEKR